GGSILEKARKGIDAREFEANANEFLRLFAVSEHDESGEHRRILRLGIREQIQTVKGKETAGDTVQNAQLIEFRVLTDHEIFDVAVFDHARNIETQLARGLARPDLDRCFRDQNINSTFDRDGDRSIARLPEQIRSRGFNFVSNLLGYSLRL